MSDSPLIVVKGDPRDPEIIPVMHRAGTIIPLTPKYFGVYSSHEEAIERARIFVRLNPSFARKHQGWNISTMRVDGQVEIP